MTKSQSGSIDAASKNPCTVASLFSGTRCSGLSPGSSVAVGVVRHP
jgi:hypothetical protein